MSTLGAVQVLWYFWVICALCMTALNVSNVAAYADDTQLYLRCDPSSAEAKAVKAFEN